MPSCSTCGLSVSETAAFCPICGTPMGRPASRPGTPSPSPAARPAEWPTPPQAQPLRRPAPTTLGEAIWAHRLALGILVAIAIIVVGGFTLLRFVEPRPYTMAKFDQIHRGMTLDQVEAVLGTPTKLHTFTNTKYAFFRDWDNPDGSGIEVEFHRESLDVPIPQAQVVAVTHTSGLR